MVMNLTTRFEQLPLDALHAYCQRQPIRRLAVFGSFLRDDFTDESDIDLLVEFDSAAKIGYFGLVTIQDELSTLLHRRVDLLTPAALSRFFRDRVLEQAVSLYETKR
jgi:uncharacterized protein